MPKFKAIATLHPAHLMRDQVLYPVVTNDLMKSLTLPPEYYNIQPTLDEVKAFDATEFAFDIETRWGSHEITMVGLCAKPFYALVVPFTSAYKPQLQRIFRCAKVAVGHNCIQFDLPILEENDVVLPTDCIVFDTMLMHHLLFPQFSAEKISKDSDSKSTGGGHDLGFVGTQMTNKPYWKHDKSVEEIYCARDTDVTMQAWRQLDISLKREKLVNLYHQVQVPLARICYLMHKTGILTDPKRIKEVRTQLLAEVEEYEKKLPEFLRPTWTTIKRRKPAPPGTLSTRTGKPIKFVSEPFKKKELPWRSTKVIQKWLYEDCQLPVQTHIKTEKVTSDKIALEKLHRRLRSGAIKSQQNDTAEGISALRKLRKCDELLSTFCKDFGAAATRIYPHFNVHGTASGRLSSSDPNLQNIPESARYIYVPSHSDWQIVEFDYSQIENRLTAFFANDTERLQRFVQDKNFSEHKWVASEFFHIPYNEVEKDNDKDAPYGKAKRINHGSNYGMGPKKISNMYDMDFKETKELCQNWKNLFKKTVQWQIMTGALAKQQGYLETPFGRRRWFYTASYYTEALSFLPQSTAADILFRAMLGLYFERIGLPLEKCLEVVKVVEPLPKPCNLLLSVHDSKVMECPSGLLDTLIRTAKTVLEQPWAELGGFQIPVGVKVAPPGASWGEAKDYKLQ